jgi:elongation factor P
MATTADMRIGMVIRYNGEMCRIDEYIHRTPGNLRAFVQAKLRNIKTGRNTEVRFRAGEELEEVRMEEKEYQYLYHDGSSYQFMEQENYEQIPVDEKLLGEPAKFLKEGEIVKLYIIENEVVSAVIPSNVHLRVTETIPGVKGDTASNTTKPATLETGASINVPLFVNEGDMIRVDTRTGEYLDRVKG